MKDKQEDGELTMRDKFAIVALEAVLGANNRKWMPMDFDAKVAYQYADAMLEARKP